jgi:hypothetical protein
LLPRLEKVSDPPPTQSKVHSGEKADVLKMLVQLSAAFMVLPNVATIRAKAKKNRFVDIINKFKCWLNSCYKGCYLQGLMP